jgi:homoserine O-acetyltransferase
MTRQVALLVLFGLCLCQLSSAASQQPARTGSLGLCRLSAGGTISDCRIGYRTFGRLSAARDNVVVIPTWLQGRSEDWIPLLGPGGYVDTARFHVLVVDALGDGHSSSPSSLPEGDRRAFPEFSIADMVTSQYRLLTEKLGIKHLHAVVGFSMGGMQALEWAVRYPTFLDRAVSIAGAPRVGAFDHLMWTVTLQEIENGLRAGIPPDSIWAQLARLEALFLQTPAAINRLSWDSVMTASAVQAVTYRKAWPLEDFAAQLKAIRHHDISRSFNGDMSRAAKAVRARVFIVHSPDDHMVTSGPAVEFARKIRARTLLIPSECGHIAIFCQQDTLAAAVRDFLQ